MMGIMEFYRRLVLYGLVGLVLPFLGQPFLGVVVPALLKPKPLTGIKH